MISRKFWATKRPFITNKEMITSNEISLKQGDDVINNAPKVAEFFNNAYINVMIRITLLFQQQLILP